MAYELPIHGELNWDEKIDASLAYLKTTADTAAAAAVTAQAAAVVAQAAADAAVVKTANLSDLTNAGTARNNLALGTAATQDSTAFDLSGAATTAQAFAIQRSQHTGTQAQATVTNLVTDLAAKAPIASPTFTGTVAGVTKSMVGLGSVDNTTDLGKPISTLTQTALTAKLDSVGLGDLPAGVGVTSSYSAGWSTRPTARTDIVVTWIGGTDATPPSGGITGDLWVKDS